MSNISGQLIRDSFNYVLQSDLISGVVFRIGGSVPVNPKFTSGLTVNANFTYSDGSEFPGYVLTCDALGNAVWAPVSGATSGVVITGGTFDYSVGTLQLRNSNGTSVTITGLTDTYVTGGTVSGTSIIFSYNDTNTFQVTGITPYNLFSSYTASTQVTINNKLDVSGFTAYTATTQPLILNAVTGGTYSNGTLNLINNSGATIPITGFTTGGTSTTDSYVTGFTLNNDLISLSQNRIDQYSAFSISLSGYVNNNTFSSYTASTQVTINNKLDVSGFTAYTATTQPLILNAVTGGTYSNGTLNLINNSGATIPITGFTTGTTDSYVTGFTLNNDLISLSQNRIDQYSAFSISLSGYVNNNTFSSYTASTQVTINNKLDVSGFTAYTATTQPLILNSVTGGTYSGGTLLLINNSGTTIPITGFTTGGTSTTDTFVTGFSYNNNQIILSQNRADTFSSFTVTLSGLVQNDVFSSYTASTQVTINNKLDVSGFTAYTATTQPLILNAVTGGTYSGGTLYLINNSGTTISITGFSNLQYFISATTPTQIVNSGDRWFNTTTGIELVYIDDGDSKQWIQPFSVPGPEGQNIHSTTGITSSQTITWDKTYWGISANTQVNLTLPTTSSKDGYYLIIKDESGFCGNYRIRLTPSVGLIDGNNYVDMNINYMSLTCMVRNGNWYLI
jgi:hypothetical protein